MPPTSAQMEAVNQLQEMFPDVDIRSLKVALFLNDYKVEDAVDFVFQEVLHRPSSPAQSGPARPRAASPAPAPTPPRPQAPQAVPAVAPAAAGSDVPAPSPSPPPPSFAVITPPSTEFLVSASPRPQAQPHEGTAAVSHVSPALPAVDDVFSSLPYMEEGEPAVYPTASEVAETPSRAQGLEVVLPTVAKEEVEETETGSTGELQTQHHAAVQESIGEAEGQRHAVPTEVEENTDKAESHQHTVPAAEESPNEVESQHHAVPVGEEDVGEEYPSVQTSSSLSPAEAVGAAPIVGPIGVESAAAEELLESQGPAADVATEVDELLESQEPAADVANEVEQPVESHEPGDDVATAEDAPEVEDAGPVKEGSVSAEGSLPHEAGAEAAVPVPPQGSASWIMAEAEGAQVLDASPSPPAAADDVPAGGPEQDELSYSMEWVTQLGSKLDLSTFSVSSFESKLDGSSKMAVELEQGILEVESLQARLADAEAEERRISAELAQQRSSEEDENERFQYANAKARDHLDQKADHLAAEKSTLGYEARQVLGRLESLRDTKQRLEEEVAELKAFLEARLVEVEARIRSTEAELAQLHEAQAQRKLAEQEEAADLARRSSALEAEAAECNKLLDFLSTSHSTIDSIAGCFSKCAEQIQSLRQSIQHAPAVAGVASASLASSSHAAHDPGLEESSLSSSFLSTREAPLSPAASGLLNEAASAAQRADAASLTRRSMREEFPGILSSSSASSASGTHAGAASSIASQSPSLSGSLGLEAVGPTAFSGPEGYDRHQAVLQMLSIGRQAEAGTPFHRTRGLNSSSGSARAAPPGLDALYLEPQPIVSVFEADVPPMASAAAPTADSPGSGSAGKEQLEDWEELGYPAEKQHLP